MSLSDSEKELLLNPKTKPSGRFNSGVKALNKNPMYIIIFALIVFIIVVLYVMSDRANKQGMEEKEENLATPSRTIANEILSKYDDGITSADYPDFLNDKDEEDTPDTFIEQNTQLKPKIIKVNQKQNLELPPQPHDSYEYSPAEQDQTTERFRMAKMQLFEEAVRSKPSVTTSVARSSGSPAQDGRRLDNAQKKLEELRNQVSARTSAADTYQQRLNQLKGLADTNQENGGQTTLAQFDGDDDRWHLNNKTQAPNSPYELRAGFVIPATLISGMNSDVSGQVIGQVSQNVYDTATGKHLLVPQGARLVGEYASNVAYGQNRLMVAWQRIIFPDGKALDIGAMQGASGAGLAGFNDRVNHHFWRTISSAILMSGVVAGVNMSQDRGGYDRGNSQRASDAMSEALGSQLGEVTAQMISKNLNIAPTIEIRAGFRFNVVVTKDLTFSKPYQSFDY